MEINPETTSKYVEIGDGLRLHYHEAGTGFPTVFLHGGGPGASGWANFSRNIEPLSKKFRVLVFDLPQFGKSSKPAIAGDLYPEFAKLIRRALDALKISQADFIGNSMGGGVSSFVAIQEPARVRRLVLMGPGGLFDSILTPTPMDALKSTFDYYNPGPPSRERMRTALRSFLYDESLLTDELVERRYQASVTPEVLEAMKGYGVQRLGDLRPHLEEISPPTLVIWGLEDRLLPLDVPLTLAKRLPNCELLVFPKSGHWVMWERANDFNRAVEEFLSR